MNKQELQRLIDLEKAIKKIAEEEGLLTTEINFEIASSQQVMEGMAYNFPINFSHWSFGRDYDRHRTIYEHLGAGLPYEQVWNFEKPRALLVETNPFALQALVIAHVYGHVDFFLANRFSRHGRSFSDVAEEARKSADRFRKYEEKHGVEAVERMIEAAFSIQWHQHPDPFYKEDNEEGVREYLIDLERAKIEAANRREKLLKEEEIKAIEKKIQHLMAKNPPEPVYDLLGYIIKHSQKPLQPWAQDVLTVIRHQARSLAPNRRTKILNEGWATYWHIRIIRRLTAEGLLTPEEHGICNYYHSKVTHENKMSLNPYRVGLALFENVEERWNKGWFGSEYENCRDQYQKANWDVKAGLGKKKIFDVRASYSDRMAVEDLFTDDFIREQLLYIYEENKFDDDIIYTIEEDDPRVIRALLKNALTFYGIKILTVEDGNYDDRGHLYLKHHPNGYDLDQVYRDGTLYNIFHLWGKKVYLETIEDEKSILATYDGSKWKAHQNK